MAASSVIDDHATLSLLLIDSMFASMLFPSFKFRKTEYPFDPSMIISLTILLSVIVPCMSLIGKRIATNEIVVSLCVNCSWVSTEHPLGNPFW